jgi:aspartyl-tRNA(Asn)/glutamyl-tRNA(Gln) amidotransferase subunit B
MLSTKQGRKYQIVIGLEIHAELKTASKMFCSCPNDPLERHPNVNVCPICMGHPGTLPVINREAVKKVIKVGLALHSEILEHSKFDRKNYFYPDLPKGYQISQYDAPLCKGGYLEFPMDQQIVEGENSKSNLPNQPSKGQYKKQKAIRIRRIHLEEDTGRLVHPEGERYSLVDFNRAGVPLMELVTEPDITSAKEARIFAQELQLILRYLGVSDADMEKGQLRIEANVSLRPEMQTHELQIQNPQLGTKVEIKNLNSFRSVEKAIEYEVERQTEILESGGKVEQETRGWHDTKQITFSQRSKEEAHDYRYFPEPDLPPLSFTKEDIQKIRAEIPELPRERRERFAKEYKLLPKEIEVFVTQKDLGEYYEKVVSELGEWIKEYGERNYGIEAEFEKLAKLAANYILSDLQGLLSGASVTGEDFLITPGNFAELIALLYEGKISSKIAKQVLVEMFHTGSNPHHIIQQKGFVPMGDAVTIEKIANEVIFQNSKAVQDYKNGKQTALQFLVGQVMARTRGTAKPEVVMTTLKKILEDRNSLSEK